MVNNKTLVAVYRKDTDRYHQFTFDIGQGMVGNLYVPKGADIPERITVELKVDKAKMEKQSEKKASAKITREEFNQACAGEIDV